VKPCKTIMRTGLALITTSLVLPAAMAQLEPTGTPPAAQGWQAVTVAEGIPRPWAITWLPDGRALVTARRGTLHVLNGKRFDEVPMDPLPGLFSQGQGGLLDIALQPGDRKEQRLYMTLSIGNSDRNHTALARGVFDGQRVRDIEILFRAEPAKAGGSHFGSRLLWLPDGTLLMSVGDGGNPPRRIDGMLGRDQAQNPESHIGKILRLTEDGKPAANNPLAAQPGARPELWAIGFRNVQGLTRDPESGRVWATEHGPRGGDELNLIEGGRNYGWPLQTFGRDYLTRLPIGDHSVKGMVDPKVAWVPAHAPSGLAFYTGKHFPAWRGSVFSGGLVSQDVRRIQLDGQGKVLRQERLDIGSRVRDVRQGPDGFLYILTDEENGRLLRIEPK